MPSLLKGKGGFAGAAPKGKATPAKGKTTPDKGKEVEKKQYQEKDEVRSIAARGSPRPSFMSRAHTPAHHVKIPS